MSTRNEFLTLRKQIIEKDFSLMNNMQREAVLSTEGPLLVLAGAGSGKTTVLVNRIANLIRYGSAYTSDYICREPTAEDIGLCTAYLNGEIPFPFELADVLKVNAPRPWEILAITFTNKAAAELKERIVSKIDGEETNIGDIWACTFHSACAKILRRHGEVLGYSSHFTIYDTDDSKRVMKECQRILEIDDKILSHKAILKSVSTAKDYLITPEEFIKEAGGDVRLRKIGQAYECYQNLLKKSDAMDFDDMIVNTVRLLETQPQVREYYQTRFKYIMVDEYQDTNHAQYKLASLLADAHKNICVVGDDDQSIYRFRGATIENILGFEDEYDSAKTIRLEQNYRSTQNILDAANAVIAHNEKRKGKALWTSNGEGTKITVHTAEDETGEGRYIAEQIMNIRAKGGKWRDNAVIYRMNAQSNSVENALVRMSIPYKIIGGHRFYERKEIRDAIAYLTVVSNPADSVRLRRIINEPKRGIGDTTIASAAQIADGLDISLYDVIKTADEYASLSRAAVKLSAFSSMMERFIKASETMQLNELLNYIMAESGYLTSLEADRDSYLERVANINELSSNLLRYSNENEEPTLNGFLEEVALMTDIDNYNADTDNVVMMTIHSAKGLEFTNVFIAGMEDGVFPGIQSMYNSSELEEERRLAYVGITRAKKNLYLTNAQTRMLFGSTTHNPPSRFIGEIPSELLEQSSSSWRRTTAGRTEQQSMKRTGLLREDAAQAASRRAENSANRGFSSTQTKKAAPQTGSVESFKVGDTVLHKVFGTGVVLSAKSMGNDCLLEIAFDKAGTKKVMAKFAQLKRPD